MYVTNSSIRCDTYGQLHGGYIPSPGHRFDKAVPSTCKVFFRYINTNLPEDITIPPPVGTDKRWPIRKRLAKRVLPWSSNENSKTKLASASDVIVLATFPVEEITRKRRAEDSTDIEKLSASEKVAVMEKYSRRKLEKANSAAKKRSINERDKIISPFFSAESRAQKSKRAYPSSLSKEYKEAEYEIGTNNETAFR